MSRPTAARKEIDSLGEADVPADNSGEPRRNARWSTSASDTTSSRAIPHMLVLGRIAHRAIADVADIAAWLAEALCVDLEAAGLLTAPRGH